MNLFHALNQRLGGIMMEQLDMLFEEIRNHFKMKDTMTMNEYKNILDKLNKRWQ